MSAYAPDTREVHEILVSKAGTPGFWQEGHRPQSDTAGDGPCCACCCAQEPPRRGGWGQRALCSVQGVREDTLGRRPSVGHGRKEAEETSRAQAWQAVDRAEGWSLLGACVLPGAGVPGRRAQAGLPGLAWSLRVFTAGFMGCLLKCGSGL